MTSAVGIDFGTLSGRAFRAFETLGTGSPATAVGGNQNAAGLMGLPVKRTQTIVYVVSGLCAGLSGILTTALSGGGQEARIGDARELSAIAAVVIGGTLLSGGFLLVVVILQAVPSRRAGTAAT